MITSHRPLILASRSPRRRALLEQVGVPVEILSAEIPEIVGEGERADAYLQRIVSDKLAAALTLAPADRPVLVADTEVVLDGAVLGKPRDRAHARELLRSLSGRSHAVMTRFAIGTRERPALAATTVTTDVFFRSLSTNEIAGYADSGEGDDKAGGYAIQGLGAFAIARIDGSYSNVVGLPICEVVAELVRLGLLELFPRASQG